MRIRLAKQYIESVLNGGPKVIHQQGSGVAITSASDRGDPSLAAAIPLLGSLLLLSIICRRSWLDGTEIQLRALVDATGRLAFSILKDEDF